ncbi:MAG: hypothetical protein AB1896_23475, partial [Thermodesulfobacteriota bacterium]
QGAIGQSLSRMENWLGDWGRTAAGWLGLIPASAIGASLAQEPAKPATPPRPASPSLQDQAARVSPVGPVRPAIEVTVHQTINLGAGATKEGLEKALSAGKEDLKSQVKKAMEEISFNEGRMSFAQ